MALGAAYQAGLRIPTPFDEQMGMMRGGGGGAYPQNTYRRGGGGGSSKPKEQRTPTPSGSWEGGVSGRFVTDAEKATRDKERRKRGYESGEKQKARSSESYEKALDREQQEKESARTAGLDREKFEAENIRTQGDYDWKQGQLKRIQAYKDVVKAFGSGDLGSVSKYLAKEYMDMHGFDEKRFEGALGQFDPDYQKLKEAIPDMQRTPDGKISILFPGQEQRVTMSPEQFMGEFLGRYNPEGEFNAQEAQADIGKTKAESRKMDRSGGMTQKDIHEIAANRAKTDMGGVDPDLYDDTLQSFGLPRIGKKKPTGTTGSISDAAPASTVPEGYKMQKNRKTGETRMVPIKGSGLQAKPRSTEEVTKPKQAGLKTKPKDGDKESDDNDKDDDDKKKKKKKKSKKSGGDK